MDGKAKALRGLTAYLDSQNQEGAELAFQPRHCGFRVHNLHPALPPRKTEMQNVLERTDAALERWKALSKRHHINTFLFASTLVP